MARQEYDKNIVQIKGVISKIYRRNGDVFVLLRAHSAAGVRTKSLLKIEKGRIDQKLVSVKQGARIQAFGYLYPEDYAISLMSFLQYAGSLDYVDKLPKEDLPQWTDVLLTYNNPAVCVQGFAHLLDDDSVNKNKAYGTGYNPQINNQVILEGIVAQQWDYPPTKDGKRFARLAVYDHYCLPDGNTVNGKLPRQKAHYFNVMIPDEEKGSVGLHSRLLIEGSLEQYSQRVTLRKALEHSNLNGNMESLLKRLSDDKWLDQVALMRRMNYVHAQAITVYDE